VKLGKFARIVGAVAGIGAITWAMRDRLVSLTLPREPEPPVFRAAPAAPQKVTTAGSEIDDLTEIVGIGPVFAGRLRVAGIMTFRQLAEAGAERAAEAAGVPASRAGSWIDDARAKAST